MEKPHLFKRFHVNAVIDFLYNERLRVLCNMVGSPLDTETTVLDIGCATGYFSRHLSSRATTIGIDVNKHLLARALIERRMPFGKPRSNLTIYVCADLSHLPFRSGSADVAVCASVLEHIENLDGALKQIKHVLKEGKILVAGYPIETVFLKSLIRMFNPKDYWCINQKSSRTESYRRCVDTHKQTFRTIRAMLRNNFLPLQRKKIPLNSLPDFLSFYECVKMVKKSD